MDDPSFGKSATIICFNQNCRRLFLLPSITKAKYSRRVYRKSCSVFLVKQKINASLLCSIFHVDISGFLLIWWLFLWCLTPLSTIFQLYRGGQFYWWRKPEKNHRPTASHWQILSHNVVLITLSGSRTHNISGDGNWLQ